MKHRGATTVTERVSRAQTFAIAGPHAPGARTFTHETAPELAILNLQAGNSISLQRTTQLVRLKLYGCRFRHVPL